MTEKNKYQTVNVYIEEFSEEVQEKLKKLRELIYEVVPEAVETFNYGVPAYTLIDGGKREEQIMMAGYKKHIGLYPHPTTIEHFSKELSKYKNGKGSVQFPLDEELPEELIIEMIRYRYKLILESKKKKI